MMNRLIAILLTTGVAIATVGSALALASLDETSPEFQAATAKVEIQVQKAEIQVKSVVVIKKAVAEPPPAPAANVADKPVRVLRAAPAARAVVTRKAAPAAVGGGGGAVVFAAAPVALNNNGQVMQFMQQFRPLLRAEYHIVRVVCQPSPEQRKSLARAGEQALRDAAVKYADMMTRPMTMAQRAALEPRKLIREGLGRAVRITLSGEPVEKYQAEIARREASRKQLGVRNLVARIDQELVLSPEQRDKVAEALTAHWDDSWCQSLEMFMYNYQYLPMIPDQYVTPILNDAQKKVWRSIQKIQSFWGGFGIMGGVMNDDPFEDEELREARLEAARNQPNLPAAPRAPMAILRPAAPVTKAAKKARVEDPPLKIIRKSAVATPKAGTRAEEKPQTKTAEQPQGKTSEVSKP